MRKYYSEPILEVRKYVITADIFTESNPEFEDDNNLHNDDEYNYFG